MRHRERSLGAPSRRSGHPHRVWDPEASWNVRRSKFIARRVEVKGIEDPTHHCLGGDTGHIIFTPLSPAFRPEPVSFNRPHHRGVVGLPGNLAGSGTSEVAHRTQTRGLGVFAQTIILGREILHFPPNLSPNGRFSDSTGCRSGFG
jgi:hypothetical protein